VEKLTVWKLITIEFNGRLVNGSYAVDGAILKVKSRRGEKATQLGGTNAIWVAGRLARVGGGGKSVKESGPASGAA
jgi:hypothetical protein